MTTFGFRGEARARTDKRVLDEEAAALSRAARLAAGRRKVALILGVSWVLGGLALPSPALAWKPGGHWVLAEKAAERLPAGNRIRVAMENHRGFSYAWGAYGHDVGYGVPEQIYSSYAPYADYLHYHKPATFAKELLKGALASGRQDLIAYAAGWVTHAAGDMYCHEIFTNPEVRGVFFDNASTIPNHRQLEEWADPYIWCRIGGHLESSYRPGTFPNAYKFDTPGALRDLFSRTAREVYGVSPSRSRCGGDSVLTGDGFERMTEYCYAGISTWPAYSMAGLYCHLDEAETELAKSAGTGRTRKEALGEAFEKGATYAADLLSAASEGDYSGFRPGWNLDVGVGDRAALNSVVVEVQTGTRTGGGSVFNLLDSTTWENPLEGPGTDERVFVWLKNLNDDPGEGYEKELDIDGYEDFEGGDRDFYYVYVDPNNPVKGLTPPTVGHFGFHLVNKHPPWIINEDDWDLNRARVWVNEELVEDWTANKWLAPQGDVNHKGDVNWWSIPGLHESFHLTWGQKVPAPSRDQAFSGDFNGDGKDDVLELAYHGPYSTGVSLFTSDGERFRLSIPWWVEKGWSPALSQGTVGDFDGDQKDELGIFYDYSGAVPPGMIEPAYNALWAFDVAPDGLTGRIVWATGESRWRASAGTPKSGDFFGDERDEIVISGSVRKPGDERARPYHRFLQVTPDMSSASVVGEAQADLSVGVIADVDGDGRDEYVSFSNTYSSSSVTALNMWVAECQASSTPSSIVWSGSVGQGWGPVSRMTGPMAGDFDGDGRDEVGLYWDLGSAQTRLWVFDFTSGGVTLSSPWQSSGWWYGAVRPIAGDFDGDSRAEPLALYDYGRGTLWDQGMWIWRPDRQQAASLVWVKRIGGWRGTGVPGSTSPLDARAQTTFELASRSGTVPAGRTVSVEGMLKSGSAGVEGAQVSLERSSDGRVFASVGSRATEAGGRFSFSVSQAQRTWYRAVFAGTGQLRGCTSAVIDYTPVAPPVAPPEQPVATALALSSSRSRATYGQLSTLSGRLTASGAAVTGRTGVTLWRSYDGGRTWDTDGLPDYEASVHAYTARRTLTRNVLYQMRFAGDSAYLGSASNSVSVGVTAYLGRPVAPSTVRRNRAMGVSGSLKPRHSGRTKLELWRRKGRRWVRYRRVWARNRNYAGYTRYSTSLRVPYDGAWRVRAIHSGSCHRTTYSPWRAFTVRR